jgi:hypothetical protein
MTKLAIVALAALAISSVAAAAQTRSDTGTSAKLYTDGAPVTTFYANPTIILGVAY